MSRTRRPDKQPAPLDAAALERLALRYVERYATTRGKLAAYLARKLRERGAAGEVPEPATLAQRMASLGYVDDRGFAENKAAALTRRGFGSRRVAQALRAAAVAADDAEPVVAASRAEALASALALARRRRFGPYADHAPDDRMQARQIGAMMRAGHAFAVAQSIVRMSPGEEPEPD